MYLTDHNVLHIHFYVIFVCVNILIKIDKTVKFDWNHMDDEFCITYLSLFQRRNGVLMSPYSVTSSVGERRLVAWFQVGGAQRGEQDLYRCLTQSTYGAAVSNFAELIVRGMKKKILQCPSLSINNLKLVTLCLYNGAVECLILIDGCSKVCNYKVYLRLWIWLCETI